MRRMSLPSGIPAIAARRYRIRRARVGFITQRRYGVRLLWSTALHRRLLTAQFCTPTPVTVWLMRRSNPVANQGLWRS
ncbi:hypothetical protein BN9982_800002 [Mycobacterium tuberculosis]|nr:hypothetical protein BN9982_800002 [Mycobacterium tuberculosis]